MTGSQLIDTHSIDTKIQELEDVLERRLTSHEIQVDIIFKKISYFISCLCLASDRSTSQCV